jgi:ribosomal protein S18 acetylase RimI-like enzyme
MRDTGKGVEFLPVDENLRASFRILASGSPRGEVREYPGVLIAHAGVTFQMFNAAFLSSPADDEAALTRRVSLASVHFRARGSSWAYWMCHGWMADAARRRLRAVMQRQGMRCVSEMPGMVADDLVPPASTLPRLDIQRVEGERLRRAFCDIGSVCFNVPAAWFGEIFDNDRIWRDFIGYVGFLNGDPVTTAATVISDDVIGLYNVGTIPGRQRQGYGEAIVRHALDQARRESGIGRMVLQSTAQGLRLYRRMGFHTVTTVEVYIL